MRQQYRHYGMEFSKKILITSYTIAISFTIFTCFLALQGLDIDALSNIVVVCWGEVAIGNGFYYWKARGENKIKMMANMDKELRDRINLEKDY